MKIRTETGSLYEVVDDKMRRVIPGLEELRRDGDWLQVLSRTEPLIGQPMKFVLEPLGEGDVTFRVTSAVVAITDIEEPE